ncbi:alpha-2,8-sialyltransferase 8E-like isoform X2 [Emydura macquarii macquarii]|uniref:alpha-2,8-sialyltransferase 8E-like isoform X2 n=1 Tax=Emydura macquarii macquarii TaxID=1129001 RepID=UPI00352B42C0
MGIRCPVTRSVAGQHGERDRCQTNPATGKRIKNPDQARPERGSPARLPPQPAPGRAPRMFQRRSWVLALCVCLTLSFIFSWLWRLRSHVRLPEAVAPIAGTPPVSGPRTQWPCWPPFCAGKPSPEAVVMGAKRCWRLAQKLSKGAFPRRLDEGWILRQLKLVRSCPWAHNASALGQHRAQLGRCCNASARLVLTQENAPLGSRMVYDGQRAERQLVQEKLRESLPQGSPFQGPPYERCAVVGNGGILRNSSCGPEIDRAQFVIRFNLPPLVFADDVGTKSSIITLNPSILDSRFWGLTRHRRPFAEAVGTYGAPQLLIPAFSFAGHGELAFRVLYTLEDFGSPARTLFMNPEYLAGLDRHWRRRGLRARRLSSGFMLVSAALELCRHLILFGFWPFPQGPDGQPLPHHYYDDQTPNLEFHAMPEEFTRLLAMHLQGTLRLHLGRCQ